MLGTLPANADPSLLVGFDTGDDACAYRLSDELVLIQTVDFFPPVVDDPFMFGQIAAANALSDIYAMGGEPKIALNILGVPACVPLETAAEILRGGAAKVMEAGAVLAGGHTIEDAEPKYGLCVTGFVRPDGLWSNAGAMPGDALFLTKPLGNGILATAAKQGRISQDEFRPAVLLMAELNKAAKDAARGLCVNACTDITGFGLLGHAYEVARASGVCLNFRAGALPVLEGAAELARLGAVPGGAARNEGFLSGRALLDAGMPPEMRAVLFDPQTSGGLLLSVSREAAPKLESRLRDAGAAAAVVGHVSALEGHYVAVL